MTLCPFCGEDVPVESQRCWKCGAELPAEVTGTETVLGDGRRAPDRSPPECRACQAPLPAGTRRCAECDTPVRSGPRRPGLPTIYAAYGITLLGLGVGLVYALATRRPPAAPAPLTQEHAQLMRVYADGAWDDVARQVWAERHAGRQVEWDQPSVVLAVREDGSLALGEGSAQPEQVVLALADPTVASDVAPRHQLTGYTGRLERIEGGTIYLTGGRLIQQPAADAAEAQQAAVEPVPPEQPPLPSR